MFGISTMLLTQRAISCWDDGCLPRAIHFGLDSLWEDPPILIFPKPSDIQLWTKPISAIRTNHSCIASRCREYVVAKQVVIDTNVLISSLLRNGGTRKIILLSPLKMHTVDYAKIEIETHKEEILRKSKLDERSLNYLFEIIFSKINFVSLRNFDPFRDKAKETMRNVDIDDSFFLALALSLNCPVWSNDSHFKKQNVVRVYSTRELLELLRTL